MLVDPPASRDEVVDLLDQLVRIESVTPWLIPTGSGERTIAEFMARWLDGLGLEITLDEVVDGRPNLLARLRGTGGATVAPQRPYGHRRLRGVGRPGP